MATTQFAVAPQVARFLDSPKRLLIGDRWVDSLSGKKFAAYNPATGEVMAQVAQGDAPDIDLAVKAARKAFETGAWKEMTPSERGRLMWKLGDLIDKNLEEFAELESLDNGKPLTVARAADVPLAADTVPVHGRMGDEIGREHDSAFRSLRARREISCIHPARAGRRGGTDYTLELSAADGGVEAGSGAGYRLHHSVEARGTDAVIRASSGRTDSGGWIPGWRGQYCSRDMVKLRERHWPPIRESTRLLLPVQLKSANSSCKPLPAI